LAQREERVAELRRRHLPSVPSTLAEELATNPFLRVGEPAVKAAAARFRGRELSDPVEVFAALREWKNHY
jgi:hydroxyacylglutathione hydrolase